MLSGPITQEAGITETRAGDEEREWGRLGRKRKWEKEDSYKGGRRRSRRIRMHEDKLESKGALNFISKVRSRLGIRR